MAFDPVQMTVGRASGDWLMAADPGKVHSSPGCQRAHTVPNARPDKKAGSGKEWESASSSLASTTLVLGN